MSKEIIGWVFIQENGVYGDSIYTYVGLSSRHVDTYKICAA